MSVSIYPIPLGLDRCYIIRDKGTIMVDGGDSNRADDFMKGIEKASVKPDEIQLVIITHGHFDHIGSVKEIKEITGAPIAMHHREKDWLETSLEAPPPPGVTIWGRILIKLLTTLMPPAPIPVTRVDLVLKDKGLSLAEYGIPGKVIYTPGHSMGSVSVLLETGAAFVGDLAMNGFPLRLSPGLPIFAEDLQKLEESWRLLLDQGAKMIYPAHGKPFSADIMRKLLA